jgi:hypothetical protein
LSAGYFASPVTRVAHDDWRHRPLAVDSPPEFMASALEHLDRVHGGAAALLRVQGITQGQIDDLVDALTEPAVA